MFAALSVLAIATLCALVLATAEVPSIPSAVRIVPLSTEFVTGQTGFPTLRVGIGNEPPVTVKLDTGSVGLRVLSTAVSHSQPAGIALTSDRTSVTFADGTNYVGVLAKAKIHIAGLTTKKPVPFQIVTMTK
jgi:Protein of unknown function (DUF3443)